MKKILLSLSLLFIFASSVLVQEKTISGQIISGEDDLGLPGVSIVVKGSVETTLVGTVTDVDGIFSLSGIRETDTLTVSYIGYQTQEIPVGKETEFSIVMMMLSNELAEVVVTAGKYTRPYKYWKRS